MPFFCPNKRTFLEIRFTICILLSFLVEVELNPMFHVKNEAHDPIFFTLLINR